MMMNADGLLLNGGGEDYRNFFRFFAISAACHILFFLVLVFARVDDPVRRIRPGVINVDLVSMPAPSAGGSPAVTTTVAPAVREKQKNKENIQSKPKVKKSIPKVPVISNKTTPIEKKKKSLKKETFQPTKVVDSAIAEMEKKVEQAESQSYQKTMERLAEQVKNRTGGQGSGEGSGGAQGFSGTGVQTSEILSVYAAEIYSYISKNWSFNEQLADGNGNLVALLGIKIMSDGEIRDVWFDRKSGNTYFDEQARKAVLKTGYLPPLPKGFNKPFLEIGLRFTPSGIQ
ncbi:MAG: hypothetical protein C4522_01150 [Desulfobacteraceae bacterium]|nr:MAG: hypothetical protein C4522_01150 [Desulfobacteraceae bacterium]